MQLLGSALPTCICRRLAAFSPAPLRPTLPPSLPLQFRLKSLKPRDLPPKPKIPESEFTEVFLKGSGPGGQKINKTNSAVQLSHIPTGIVVKCQATRSREQNRKIARDLLAMKVDEHFNGEMSRENLKESIKARKKGSRAKKARRKYKKLAEGAAGEEGEEDEEEDGFDSGDEEDDDDVEEGKDKDVSEDSDKKALETHSKKTKKEAKPKKHNTPTKADKFTAKLPSDFSAFLIHHPEEFDLFQNPTDLNEPETIEEYCTYLQQQFATAKTRNPDAFDDDDGEREMPFSELTRDSEFRRELENLWADYQDRLTRTCSNVPPRPFMAE